MTNTDGALDVIYNEGRPIAKKIEESSYRIKGGIDGDKLLFKEESNSPGS